MEIVWPVPAEEVPSWLDSLNTTFLEDPAEGRARAQWRSRHWQPERGWGVRDRGRWVATLRTIETTLSVPGGTTIAADGLTAVTVAATHRRQGLLSAMLTKSLAAAKDRGDAVSILIAAEYPIYGRFGYSPTTLAADYVLHSRRQGSVLRHPADREVREVAIEEFREIAPAVFDSARLARAGNIHRSDPHWDARLGVNDYPDPLKPSHVFVVHDGPDGVDGYVSWAPGAEFDFMIEGGEVRVAELQATTEDAYRALFQYLLGIDLVDRVQLPRRPIDEALGWLLVDGRALQERARADHLWLRLLDVPAALSARTYQTQGRIVFEVTDNDTGGYAAGRFALQVAADGVRCEPSNDPVDLHVHQRGLASAYLGGHSFTRLQIAGLVEQQRPGAMAQADVMFATPLAPWLATNF